MPKTCRFLNGVEWGVGIVRDGVDASSVGTLPGRRPAVLRVSAGVESMVGRVRVVGGGCRCRRGVGRCLGGLQSGLVFRGRSLFIGNPKCSPAMSVASAGQPAQARGCVLHQLMLTGRRGRNINRRGRRGKARRRRALAVAVPTVGRDQFERGQTHWRGTIFIE